MSSLDCQFITIDLREKGGKIKSHNNVSPLEEKLENDDNDRDTDIPTRVKIIAFHFTYQFPFPHYNLT